MPTQPQQSTLDDVSHWIQDFEQHRVELEKQMQQFTALQQEIAQIAEQAPQSPKAAQQLQQLQQLEQSSEYQQLREQAMKKLQQLDMQFSQLSQQCTATSAVQPSASADNRVTGQADDPAARKQAKSPVRSFI